MMQDRATQAMVGKTIQAVIARPQRAGRPQVVMLQFDDGSCFEFVTPLTTRRAPLQAVEDAPLQLALTA